ncbi:MAG: hypothetical protein ACWGNI_00105 [Desulfobacterales bacterium]
MKSIINNTRDLLNSISNIENELNGINVDIVKLKSAKATITQPTDNQLLTWDEDLSMVINSLWQLPAADGAANEILYTDGAGNLGWIAPGAAAVAGADTQVQYNFAGVMGAEAAFTYNYNTNTLTADHYLATTDFAPSVADGASLGTAALEFSDLYLADSSVIYFGADQDVTLTHVHNTGIILNSSRQLQFRDAQIYISSIDDGHLDLTADTQIDLNNDVYVNGHVGIMTVPDVNYVPLLINETITARFNSVRGIEDIIHWNPSANSGGDFLPINVAAYPEGSNTMRDIYAGAWGFYATSNSNACRNYQGFYALTKRNLTTMTFSGYASMFTLDIAAVAGVAIAVAGNGYGLWMRNYTSVFNIGGTAYGIKQEGDLENFFEGNLNVDSDTNGLILGDGQDAGIYYDGSDMIFDSQLVGAGNFIFNNGYLRTDTSRYRRYYHLPLASFDPGASGATWTSATGDHLSGWQLNSDTDILEFESDVHADWDGVTDLTVEIRFQLLDAGNPGDTVDLRLVMYYMGDGETATKTQSDEVATVTDGTQYKMYTVTFTIDHDLAGNLVDVGDVISFELNLETDTSEIDNVLIVGGSIYYNTTHTGIESGDI